MVVDYSFHVIHSDYFWITFRLIWPPYYLIRKHVYVTLEHKTSLTSLGYIYNNSQKYIVWIKMIIFLLYQNY